MGSAIETPFWPSHRPTRPVSERGRRRPPRGRSAAVFLATLLLVGVGSPATAQTGAERLRGDFPSEALGRIQAIADLAERDGIPSRLVVDKALEGAAKGASPEQVISALSDYVDQLRAARRLVGAEVRPDVLVSAVEALRRGASREDVRTLAAGRPPDLAMALLVLGDLAEEGAPGPAARSLIQTAVQEGWRGDRLLSLSAAVRRLLREGASPAEAVARTEEALRRGDLP